MLIVGGGAVLWIMIPAVIIPFMAAIISFIVGLVKDMKDYKQRR